MAQSIIALIRCSDLPQEKLFVMEGHEEGIFSFGVSLEEAFDVLEQNLG